MRTTEYQGRSTQGTFLGFLRKEAPSNPVKERQFVFRANELEPRYLGCYADPQIARKFIESF